MATRRLVMLYIIVIDISSYLLNINNIYIAAIIPTVYMLKLSPHPHSPFEFGFSNLNSDEISVSYVNKSTPLTVSYRTN